MKKSLGIYIHIPFCIKKCLYCDFCSFPDSQGEKIKAYADELCRRIENFSRKAPDHTVDTVYFGGGTPTLLPLTSFDKIMRALRESFNITDNCEISAECNPASADLCKLTHMRALGINRLSIGLQSIHNEELAALGRVHDFEDFCKLYENARAAGYDNISVDLMYGIPKQSLESFRKSLTTLAEMRPEHISAYGLKIEEGTPFYKLRDTLTLPDEDTEYQMYLSISEILSKYGYEKYEISNFSLPNYPSRHNLRYWQRLDYIGFGVAAHSCFDGERFGNSRDIDAFLRGENIECERSELNENDKFTEYIMLSLRLTSGIELEEFKKKSGVSFFEFYGKAEELVRQGFFEIHNGRIAFTDKGFFVSNSILSDILSFD